MVKQVLVENETFSSAISQAVNYNNWLVSIFVPYLGQKVLEVGIGHGGFGDILKQHGVAASYSGVDIDQSLVDHARLEHPENSYFCADVCLDSLPEVIGEKFDSILCANVIEHIPEDDKAIKNMLRLLKPGGHLLLFAPAFQSLYSDMDKLAGHYRRYTKKTFLQAVPEDFRKNVVRLDYFNAIGGLGWYVNKFKKYDSLENDLINGQILFFDKYILPISRLINPVTKNFFGQSIVGIIRNDS